MSENDQRTDVCDGLPRSPELMRADDTALVVVDMQPRLIAAQPNAARLVWNCRRLLDAAAQLGVRRAATEQNPEKLGATMPLLAERLAEAPHSKMAFSSAACGLLWDNWRSAGIERVLLCGIETHVCVAQTALDLLSAGYRVYVAADAVGARFAIDHDTALGRLEASGVAVTTTEAAMFEWCGCAGTPEFRAISVLAKEPPPSE